NKPIILQETGIHQVINDALTTVNDLILGHRIILEKDLLPYELYIPIDKNQLKKALVNIFTNAVESMENYPKILNISTIKDSGFYSILIEDNGKKVDENFENKIFEPFFTTKKDAEGLGLTEAQRIILAHNGNISYKAL